MSDPALASGPFQRFQMEHGRFFIGLYQQNGLISRENGFLMVELAAESRVIGFVRYASDRFPDADNQALDIGFGIANPGDRQRGYMGEALTLLLDYLFAGYPVPRISALTDAENTPSRRLLESLGFVHEGAMRQSFFRGGAWRDLCMYGLLRSEWAARRENT